MSEQYAEGHSLTYHRGADDLACVDFRKHAVAGHAGDAAAPSAALSVQRTNLANAKWWQR